MADNTNITEMFDDMVNVEANNVMEGGINDVSGGTNAVSGGTNVVSGGTNAVSGNKEGGEEIGAYVTKYPILGWIMVISVLIVIVIIILALMGKVKFGKCPEVAALTNRFASEPILDVLSGAPSSLVEQTNIDLKKSHMSPSGAWRYTDGDAGSNSLIDAGRKSHMTGSGAWRYTDGDSGSNPNIDTERKSNMTGYPVYNPNINEVTNWQQSGAQRQHFCPIHKNHYVNQPDTENKPYYPPPVSNNVIPAEIENLKNDVANSVEYMDQPQYRFPYPAADEPRFPYPAEYAESNKQNEQIPHISYMNNKNGQIVESMQNRQQQESMQNRQQQELMQNRQQQELMQNRQNVELMQNRQQELMQNRQNVELMQNRQQQELMQNRQQELMKNRQQQELMQNRQQELMKNRQQQELMQNRFTQQELQKQKSNMTVGPDGKPCPPWENNAINEARVLGSMGVYQTPTPGMGNFISAVTGGKAPMTDEQLVSIMFGGMEEPLDQKSSFDSTNLYAMNTTSSTVNRENPLIPYTI